MPLSDRPCIGLAPALHRLCFESPPPEVAPAETTDHPDFDTNPRWVRFAAQTGGLSAGFDFFVSGASRVLADPRFRVPIDHCCTVLMPEMRRDKALGILDIPGLKTKRQSPNGDEP
jgi:hypothetical protein